MGLGFPFIFPASSHQNHTGANANDASNGVVPYRSSEEKALFTEAVEYTSGQRTLESIKKIEISQNERCIKMWSELLTGVREGATLSDFNILMKCFMKEAKNRGCSQVLLISENGPILVRPRLLSGGSLRYEPAADSVTKKRYQKFDEAMTKKILMTLHAQAPNISAIIDHDAEGVLSSMMPTEYDSNASQPQLEKSLVVSLLDSASGHVVLEAHERLANSRVAEAIRIDSEQTIPKRIYTIARPDQDVCCDRIVEAHDRLRNSPRADSIQIDPEPTLSAQANAIGSRDESAHIYATVERDGFAETHVQEGHDRLRNSQRTGSIPTDPVPATSRRANAMTSGDDSAHIYATVNKNENREDERIYADANVRIINRGGPPSTSSSDSDDSYASDLDPDYAELDYRKPVDMRRPVPHPPGGLHETIQNSISRLKKRNDGSVPHQSGRYERRFRPNGELYEIRYEDSGTAPNALTVRPAAYSHETRYLESGYPYEVRTDHQTGHDKPRAKAVSLKKKADQQPAPSTQSSTTELFGPERLV